jgi:hypothetical protein
LKCYPKTIDGIGLVLKVTCDEGRVAAEFQHASNWIQRSAARQIRDWFRAILQDGVERPGALLKNIAVDKSSKTAGSVVETHANEAFNF